MSTLYINGKFSAQSVTGVQRTALELVLALDRLLDTDPAALPVPTVLLCPPESRLPALRHIPVRTVSPRLRSLFAWEQVVLPHAARDGVLLNLSGSAPWRRTRRSVCTLHDAAVFDHPDTYTAAFRLWYRQQFRHQARHAAHLLTVSRFSRDRLTQALAVPANRIGVLLEGADHFGRVQPDGSALTALGVAPRRYLLAVGTAKHTKNVAALLATWRRMRRDPDCWLVWVGGTNARVFADDAVHTQSTATDQADRIVRAGVVPDTWLKALYENAAGLVVPSTYEGFGLPAVEAMVCGCPVAAARAGALPEVCGDAALYFDPHSTPELTHAIEGLLNDAPLRRQLVDRGRARAAGYTWDAAARGLLAQLRASRLWSGLAR